MERIRKPFQGVWNIIRFNWHFYGLSFGAVLLLLFLGDSKVIAIRLPAEILVYVIASFIVISLAVSAYVYDLSNLYSLSWLDELAVTEPMVIVNINAGFDETSQILATKFARSTLIVLDFYDPVTHTEVSIRRARKIYGAFANTLQVKTTALPLNNDSADLVLLILAAHEIRRDAERVFFMQEIHRMLSPSGQVVVTEHLRGPANFLAYNIGAFHFYSRKSWLKLFHASGLHVTEEIPITPFITSFILDKNGTTA